MGKLQDNQYNSFTKSKKPSKTDSKKQDKNLLLQQFCPPLDSSLVEAIWADTYDYAQSSSVLKELAKEAEMTLAVELTDDFEALDIQYSIDKRVVSSSTATTTTTPTASLSDTQSGSTDSQDDDIAFLSLCFPDMDPAHLKTVLSSHDNDVEKATDILLNSMYLESDDYINATASENNDDILFYGTSRRKQERNGHADRHTKRKQLLWSSRYVEDADRRQQQDRNNADNGPLSTLPFNYWHQYDDMVGQIHQVFPSVPRSTVHGCVQRCKGNMIASVVMIMAKSPEYQPVLYWQLSTNLDQVEQGIASVLVDRTADQIRRIAVGVVIQCQSDHDVRQMIQQGVNFALTYEKQQQELAERMASISSRFPSVGVTNNAAGASSAAKSLVSNDMPVIPEYLLMNNQQSYTDDDPELCRTMAMDLILTRNELFQKASAAFRAGKNKKAGEQGVAFFYSDEARQLDAKAKEWNMRAARAYVREKRLKQDDDHLLDLHGLTINEAKTMVSEGLTQWWSRSQIQRARRKIQPLQIVTGVGNHSEGRQARLLPSIQKLLRDEGWIFDTPKSGCFLVKGVVSKTK